MADAFVRMWWFFEIAIYFYLISVGAFLMETFTQWNESRRHTLLGAVALVLAVGWAVIFYGSFIEPRRLVVRETQIALRENPKVSVRVAVISDLHLGPYKGEDWTRTVTDKINELTPDMVVLVGDYIATDSSQAAGLAPLSGLLAPLGVYAVLGNHDYYEEGKAPDVVHALEEAGARVLENERVAIAIDGRVLTLVGISDIWFDADSSAAFEGLIEDDAVVLLSHNPDVVMSAEMSLADLTISGHTHGGQIRLPWYGPVPTIPDALGQKYDRGLFTYDGEPLFITSGVGETGSRARLFNPPVVDLLQLEF